MEPLESVLGYRFKDSQLLIEALTHASHGYESQRIQADSKAQPDNQRLEFLGDSVFQLTLSEMLYLRMRDANEGILTKMRAELVSTKALAQVARRLQLGNFLLMGRGEEASGGREREKTLADALEAVAGAVYLDGGMPAAKELAVHLFNEAIKEITNVPAQQNPKGHLQEILQAFGNAAPTYAIVQESGPDHAKSFEATVCWQGVVLGSGQGKSKKEAEAEAARSALGAPDFKDKIKSFTDINYKALKIFGLDCEEPVKKGTRV